MNSNFPIKSQNVEWTGSEGERGNESGSTENATDTTEGSGIKCLIRQDSIHDLTAKTLIRQNSFHDADKKFIGVSSDRSLSWDNYVDDYSSKDSDEILQGLREIQEQLKESDDYDFAEEDGRNKNVVGFPSESSNSRKTENLSIDSHQNFKPNLSQTSSKNTQYSGSVSDFSFESNWNSKQSVSLETYQSHNRNREILDTSSGITSISEDTSSSKKTSSGGYSLHRKHAFQPPFDSSEDFYEYDDDEMAVNLSSNLPSVDEDLMAKGKGPRGRKSRPSSSTVGIRGNGFKKKKKIV